MLCVKRIRQFHFESQVKPGNILIKRNYLFHWFRKIIN